MTTSHPAHKAERTPGSVTRLADVGTRGRAGERRNVPAWPSDGGLRLVSEAAEPWPGERLAGGHLAAALVTMESHWAALLAADIPDGTYAFRVSARQLRTALHVFRPGARDVETRGGYRSLRQSLAKASRLAGRLRDLDVMVMEMMEPLFDGEPPPGATAARAVLDIERRRARADLCAALAADEMTTLRGRLDALRQRLERADAGEKSASAVGDGHRAMRQRARRDLRKRWRRFCDKAHGLEQLSIEQLHEARKALRLVRYALIHFAPYLKADDVVPFHKRIRRLQDALGTLNDVASAKALMTELGPAMTTVEAHHALGIVFGAHAERARRKRRQIGPRFKKLAATKLARTLAKPSA